MTACRRRSYGHPVTARDTLDQLPEPYARALTLQSAGADAATIAQALGLDEDAVPALLQLAVAKRDAANRAASDDASEDTVDLDLTRPQAGPDTDQDAP